MRISAQRFIVPLLVSFSLTGAAVILLYFLNKKKNEDELKIKNKKSNELSVVMKIPRQLVPAVIGRAGLTITKIQLNTKTKIVFDCEDNMNLPERTCIITGKLENINLAKQDIDCILKNQPIIETYETWVPQKTIANMLERGGELLNQIQNSSNAKIIFENSLKHSNSDLDTEKRVILKGTAEQITDALVQIEDKIKEDKEMRLKTETSSLNRVPRIKTPPAVILQNGVKNAEYSKEVFGNLTSEGLMEVFVSAVENPNLFYIQVANPSYMQLDDLIQEMSTYYELQENKELHTLRNISVGQMVSAQFSVDKKWYRGEIVADLGDQMYNVYFVDFGDCDKVNSNHIFELRTDFLSLRLQAVECSLAGVKPWDNEWSQEAIETFKKLVRIETWQLCTAKIRGYKERSAASGPSRREGSPIPCIEVYANIDDQPVNIGKELIRLELARPENEPWSAASSTLSLPQRCQDWRPKSPEAGPTPRTTPTRNGDDRGIGIVYEEIDLTESPKPKTPKSIEMMDLMSPVSHTKGDATRGFIANERSDGVRPATNGRDNDKPRNRPENPFSAGANKSIGHHKNIIPAGFESEGSQDSDEFELY